MDNIIRFDKSLWNSTNVKEGIQSFIKNMTMALRPKTKLKILTNCNMTTELCRFLACPDISKNCFLCEVQLKNNNKNSTVCEKFSTQFLISHRQI